MKYKVNNKIQNSQNIGKVIALVLSFAATVESAQAAGKKPADVNAAPTITTPNPARPVIIEAIDTVAFNLPNGNNVDMRDSLHSILSTVVASTQTLTPVQSANTMLCDSYLAIHTTITEFQMDIASVGLTFGYSSSPTGPVPIQTGINVNGAAQVKVGAIAIEFELRKYVHGQWSAPVAAHADQTAVSQAQLTINLDLEHVKTGASFVYNPQMENIFRSIMNHGINQIAGSKELTEFPWQAQVRDYQPADGQTPGAVIFDAGVEDRLQTNQAFTIFSASGTATVQGCDVYCAVADVHTTNIDMGSSTAVVDGFRQMKCGEIRQGDIVKIRKI